MLRKITDPDNTLLAEEFEPNRWKVYNHYESHDDPHYPFFLYLNEKDESVVRSYAKRRFFLYPNSRNRGNDVQNINDRYCN